MKPDAAPGAVPRPKEVGLSRVLAVRLPTESARAQRIAEAAHGFRQRLLHGSTGHAPAAAVSATGRSNCEGQASGLLPTAPLLPQAAKAAPGSRGVRTLLTGVQAGEAATDRRGLLMRRAEAPCRPAGRAAAAAAFAVAAVAPSAPAAGRAAASKAFAAVDAAPGPRDAQRMAPPAPDAAERGGAGGPSRTALARHATAAAQQHLEEGGSDLARSEGAAAAGREEMEDAAAQRSLEEGSCFARRKAPAAEIEEAVHS